IVEYLNIQIEIGANPFTFNEYLNSFSPLLMDDLHFGATPSDLSSACFEKPAFTRRAVVRCLKNAQLQSEMGRTIILFLPLWKNDRKICALLTHAHTLLICAWPAYGFFFLSPVNSSPSKRVSYEV